MAMANVDNAGCVIEFLMAYSVGNSGRLILRKEENPAMRSVEVVGKIVAYAFRNVGNKNISLYGKEFEPNKCFVLHRSDLILLAQGNVKITNARIGGLKRYMKEPKDGILYLAPVDANGDPMAVKKIVSISIHDKKGSIVGFDKNHTKNMEPCVVERLNKLVTGRDTLEKENPLIKKRAEKVNKPLLQVVKVVKVLANPKLVRDANIDEKNRPAFVEPKDDSVVNGEIKGYVMAASFNIEFQQPDVNGRMVTVREVAGKPFVVNKEGLNSIYRRYGNKAELLSASFVEDATGVHIRRKSGTLHSTTLFLNAAIVQNGKIVGIHPKFAQFISK